MKIKRTLCALLAALLLMTLGAAGCQKKNNQTEGDQLERIRQKGSITVAMEGTWAPWTYHNEQDELVNGVGITAERQEKYDFSTPYAYNRTAVIVRGEYEDIHSMEDLKGKTTANTISSTYAEQAEAYGATVTCVDDLNQTIELLLSGRIDATLNAEVVFADYKNAHPEANIKIAAYSDDVERVAIPVRKGADSATLLDAINQALAELSADGTLTALSEKYFGTDISKEN